MTNQAIIIVDPAKDKDLLFRQINGKMFFHYQLSYLDENLFKKIVVVDTDNAAGIKTFFGSEYLGMEMIYIYSDKDFSESKALKKAFDLIDDIFAFVFDAHHFFRLNLGKADDFRRMRDSKILHIGKKYEGFFYDDLHHLELDEKGRISQITSQISIEEADTFYTACWLISKSYFQKQFESVNSSLIEILKQKYLENHQYCLACRQYFIRISSEKDLEKAKNEFTEYHYQ